MSDSNTAERSLLQLAVKTLATELGASPGDALVLDENLMPVLATPEGGAGNGGSLPDGWTQDENDPANVNANGGALEVGSSSLPPWARA